MDLDVKGQEVNVVEEGENKSECIPDCEEEETAPVRDKEETVNIGAEVMLVPSYSNRILVMETSCLRLTGP